MGFESYITTADAASSRDPRLPSPHISLTTYVFLTGQNQILLVFFFNLYCLSQYFVILVYCKSLFWPWVLSLI